MYDKHTKTWAVLDGNQALIISQDSGNKYFHTFKNCYKLESVSYVNGMFYYIANGSNNVLCMEDSSSKKYKEIVLESNICGKGAITVDNVTSKGFDLVSEKGVFEVRLG